MLRERRGGERRQRRAVGAQGIAGVLGEDSGPEHVEARDSKSLGPGVGFAAIGLGVAPGWPRSGIEQNAGDREIKGGTGPVGRARPRGIALQRAPAIEAAGRKMPPARVKRHIQRRVIDAHGVQHEIGAAHQPA
jgi:hypothetical protein